MNSVLKNQSNSQVRYVNVKIRLKKIYKCDIKLINDNFNDRFVSYNALVSSILFSCYTTFNKNIFVLNVYS